MINMDKNRENQMIGDGYFDEVTYIKSMESKIEQLESILMSNTPVCPHCLNAMSPCNYSGYYDSFSCWMCDCEEFENIDTYLGMYA